MPDQGPAQTMTTKLISGIVGPKTDIRICLKSRREAFSTLDRIPGTVVITPSADLAFDDIDIEFVGTSRTFVDRMSSTVPMSGRQQAFQQFLRLSQPGVAEHYPENCILKAGQSYKFPFVFAVPERLLPRVCNHGDHSDTVTAAHLQLPPSLGDCEAKHKSEQLDDFAPDMASIRYGVYVKVSRAIQGRAGPQRTTIVAKARKVRIIPATEEQPPVDTDDSQDFVMRKEKKLRKGLLKGKLGTLVMEASQPASLRLPAPDADADERTTTTMASVLLRFDPAEQGAQPPKLNTLVSKLKVTTFFSTVARKAFPTRADHLTQLSTGLHSESIEISSRCMANVDWTRFESQRAASPDSMDPRRASSTVSGPLIAPEASTGYTNGAFYAARILVPIELPSNKAFVPTFHTCLISRAYTLGLSLSTNTAFGGNLDLRLPVQISASPSRSTDTARPSITSLSAVELDDESANGIDEFFEPRTIHAPEAEYVGGSRLSGDVVADETPARRASLLLEQEPGSSGLPEYSLFAPGSRGRRNRVPVF